MTAAEFEKGHKISLETVGNTILVWAQRKPVVIYGAHAVNYYLDVNEQRLTRGVDFLALDTAKMALSPCEYLRREFPAETFEIHEHVDGFRRVEWVDRKALISGFWKVRGLPNSVGGELKFVTKPHLIALKKNAINGRTDEAKRLMDQADLIRLERSL